MNKWYYDAGKRRCFPFIYGGCGGNSNRYKSVNECMQKCAISGRSTCILFVNYLVYLHFNSLSRDCLNILFTQIISVESPKHFKRSLCKGTQSWYNVNLPHRNNDTNNSDFIRKVGNVIETKFYIFFHSKQLASDLFLLTGRMVHRARTRSWKRDPFVQTGDQ